MSESDRLLLEACVELAERGRFTCAPNPTVGCIVVRNDQIIGRGYHAVTGQGHAEVQAIEDAGGDIRGSTVYVSLEPCSFAGRTPACAQMLIDAGVARVVIAHLDPHPKVSGQGVDLLERAGIEVTVLPLESAARSVRGYTLREIEKRPFVRLKSASSLDGAVALASGESRWITGEAARQDVQYWRARSDAILTGVGTVLADDPALTVRRFERVKQPLRVVLDTELRTPPNAQIVTDGGATLIVHDGAEGDTYAERLDERVTLLRTDPHQLDAVLAELAARDCNEVLVESGAGVLTSFLKARLWDEWIAYVAPSFLGERVRSVTNLALTSLAQKLGVVVESVDHVGDDLRLKLVPRHE